MSFYLAALGSIIFRLAGNFFGKLWIVKGNVYYYIAAIALYLVFSNLFLFAVKKSSLSVAAPLIATIMVVGSVLMGYFYFHEKITTHQFVGILLAIPVLILLTFPFK